MDKLKERGIYAISCRYIVEMDRHIQPDRHYISPGTMEIKTSDNKIVRFDFLESRSFANGKELTCELCLADVLSFPEMRELPFVMKDIAGLDVFVYTGEEYEPEINPVRLKEFVLTVGVDTSVCNIHEDESSPYVTVKVTKSEHDPMCIVTYTCTDLFLSDAVFS